MLLIAETSQGMMKGASAAANGPEYEANAWMQSWLMLG
jgi:hypothetical protein